jgi:hypothetical protein
MPKEINEYEYNSGLKKGNKRDPEIENIFREKAERAANPEMYDENGYARHKEHR